MAKRTIFYSWMDDGDASLNKNFISDCLNRAVKKLNREGVETYEVVRDTQGTIGIVDIVDAILKRIDECSVFIADVSIINPQAAEGERLVSNPNVMFELGYAIAKHGKAAIIAVANTARGPIEKLPFDIRAWRVLSYQMEDGTDKAAAREELVNDLVNAIKTSLGETGEARIARQSEGFHQILDVLVIYGNLEHIKDEDLLTKTKELIPVAFKIGQNLHDELSFGFAGLLSQAIRKLQATAAIVPSEENFKRIRDGLESACSDIELGAQDVLNNLRLDEGATQEALNTVREVAAWATEATIRFEGVGTGETDVEDRRAFSRKTHDLQRRALMPLLPEHPGFIEKLRPIAERARKAYFSNLRQNLRSGEAMANAARVLRDEVTELIAVYAFAFATVKK